MADLCATRDGAGLRIGIVHSRFNAPVVERMVEACAARLAELGVPARAVDRLPVPGALEIPIALQALAVTRRYDALVALGAVIRGETYHFEVVANESCRGVMDVALDTGVPIANGILTVDSDAQAEARIAQKARDCAECAVEMANALAAVARAAAGGA
jgi:6,7-dimethyl-8-ribityllumazine synthase